MFNITTVFSCAHRIISLAIVYFISGKISLLVSSENHIVTIVYFASEGFALAAILLYGRMLWPGILIGQFLLAADTGMMFFPAFLIALINSVEALLGAILFQYFKLDKSLEKLKDISGLLLIIILFLQPFSAILGNLVLVVFSISEWQNYFKNTLSWWFGNSMGQFLFTPFLLLLSANFKSSKIKDYFVSIVALGLLTYLVLISYPISSLSIIISITLPLVILIALYENIVIAYCATVVIAIITLYATYIESGFFSYGDPIDNIIDLNFFIFSHVFLTLIIGTLFSERREAERQLDEKNQQLKEVAQLREQVEYMNQHDLKNLLNVVVNGPDFILVDEDLLSDNSKTLLEEIKNSGYTMLDMINRSLDMYKMETGNYQLNAECIDLIYILKKVLHGVGKKTQDKVYNYPITISGHQLKSSDAVFILAESLLCYSLFSNLIRNAFEASLNSSVLIQISFDKNTEQCVIVISNDGVVPENIRDTFFEKLVSSHKKAGTGIGTYSARLCTEIQNGAISLDCSVENQTRIIVKLPLFSLEQ